MATNKTKPNRKSVEKFLLGIDNETKREDSLRLLKIMGQITREEPRMWGPSIVGFGTYKYRYESGREGDWFLAGFSPRKQALTLYIMSGFTQHDRLMKKLGTYTTGKSCLYVKKLKDVDLKVLKSLIRESVKHVKKTSIA